MGYGGTPMHKVCGNKNSELLKLLLEAKLVDQDMLKIQVSVHEMCYVIFELKHWRLGMNYEH